MDPRIKIVTAFDGDCPWWNHLEANLREYSGRWGYDLVMKSDGWGPIDRCLYWRKMEPIKNELADCDWLLWLDPDCFVINMAIPVTQYIDDSFDLGTTGPFDFPCPNAKCPNRRDEMFSTGVLLIRRCRWSRDLLEAWWESEHDPAWRHHECDKGWIGDNTYFTCHIMQQPEHRKHIRGFPLKEIGWATIANDPSQFIVHQYGSAPTERVERFEQFRQHTIR